MIHLHKTDNMRYMRECLDGKFDLAIADPPYGIFKKQATGFMGGRGDRGVHVRGWDQSPKKEYFDELRRVSKNQIIFGGNYFGDFLGAYRAPIIWDKMTGANYFADGEMAWTSFKQGTLRIFRHQWCGAFKDSERGEVSIHPTQKPIALYSWILNNYAKKGWKIFDPNLGSASSAIAAHRLGFDFVGLEKDSKYFKSAEKRLANELSQVRMF